METKVNLFPAAINKNQLILGRTPRREVYLGKVSAIVDSMVKARLLTANDGEKIKKDAEKLSAW
jgi:hypothetical protein